MNAIDAKTGLRIVSTLERLEGSAAVTNFRRNSEGRLEFDSNDGTNIFYDTAQTAADDAGDRIFLNEDGTPVPERDVKLVETETETEPDDADNYVIRDACIDLAVGFDEYDEDSPTDPDDAGEPRGDRR